MPLTPGLSRAISKGGAHTICACGFPIPKYPGRYPKTCPHCHNPITAAGDAPAGQPAPAAEVVDVPDELAAVLE